MADAPQVRASEYVGAYGGILGGYTHLLEYGRHGLPERVLRDPDLVFLRHFESLEHGILSLLSCHRRFFRFRP